MLFIGEDGGFPLGEFEREVGGESGLAGEAPAGLDGIGREQVLVGGSDGEFALEDFDPATAAAAASAAGEFGAGAKEDILQGGIGGQVERLARGLEFEVRHGV